MPNPRFIQQAERWKNEKVPRVTESRVDEKEDNRKPSSSRTGIDFPTSVSRSFLLEYDDFGKEVIGKANERFLGTRAEIPIKEGGFLRGKSQGEVPNAYILKRLALTTAVYHNQHLRDKGLWPITPLQSEVLLKDGKLPDPKRYWEDLGLLLYGVNGNNSKEASALLESITRHKKELGLDSVTIEPRYLVVNAGLEKDPNMPHGVRPIVLPGVTQVYRHKTLEKIGQNAKFAYGLEHGLPDVSELGQGTRTLYMPAEAEPGLRVLVRDWDLSLGAWYRGLVYDDADGRVNFAPQGNAKK